MSSIDRFTNLARGVLADSQKQLEAEGGLEGAARRMGARVREVAESTRSAVAEGIGSLSETGDPPLIDPALEAARREVANLKSVAGAHGVSAPTTTAEDATPPKGLAGELRGLDDRLHAGQLSRAEWEVERSRLLDAHDRAASRSTPRRRTL
jgi:hypothetical protein